MQEKELNLHEKIQQFEEKSDSFWVSPLILPHQVGDHDVEDKVERNLTWKIIIRKEHFFDESRFLRVLVADRESWFENEHKTRNIDSFHFPNQNIAVIREFGKEIKRII
jgi:hypothetical protein